LSASFIHMIVLLQSFCKNPVYHRLLSDRMFKTWSCCPRHPRSTASPLSRRSSRPCLLPQEQICRLVIHLIRKRLLLSSGTRVHPLRRLPHGFPAAHSAGVFFRRKEVCRRVRCLLGRCRLLACGKRRRLLRPFAGTHPVIIAI